MFSKKNQVWLTSKNKLSARILKEYKRSRFASSLVAELATFLSFYALFRMNLTEYRRQYSLESIHETTVTREHSLIREISERRVPEAYQSEYYIQFSNPALRIKGQNGVLKDENHASEVPVDKPSSNKGMDSINSVGTIRDQAEHKIIEPEVTTGKVKALRDAIERHEYNNAVLGGWNENSSDVTIARSPNKAITTGKPPIIQYGCGNTNPAVPQHYMKTFNVKAPVSEVSKA